MIVMYFMLLFGEITSGCGTQLLLLGSGVRADPLGGLYAGARRPRR